MSLRGFMLRGGPKRGGGEEASWGEGREGRRGAGGGRQSSRSVGTSAGT